LGSFFQFSRLYGFFCELRRRKVYRVAGGYGVVGWRRKRFVCSLSWPKRGSRSVTFIVMSSAITTAR